jgi:hypothetical protein
MSTSRQKYRLKLIFLAPLLASIQLLAGAGRELHVSTSGSPQGNGSKASPFLTIGQAVREAQPGDVVIIHAGTYREEVTLPAGGAGEQFRIVFRPALHEEVIIKGSDRITTWRAEGNGIWRADLPASLFHQYNPFAQRVGRTSDYHLGQVFVDNTAYMEQLSPLAMKAIKRSWFAEVSEDGSTHIRANFGAADPNKQIVEISVRAAAFRPERAGINYITLDHIKVAQVACEPATVDGEQPAAVSTGGGTHWIIENCEITDIKSVGISLSQPGGRDTSRNSFNRPAFGEFEDIRAVGHHVVRNNLIRRCGQAGIFSVVHGSLSDISGNQIEDINKEGLFCGDNVSGVRLVVAVDAIVRNNLIRAVYGGSGIILGPVYQGTRITANIICGIEGSPLYFLRSHGLALIDRNIVAGTGGFSGEGVKLRGAEANVFVHNLFVDCAFSNEPLPGNSGGGTISYRPHTLIVKQTIPAMTVDNKWFANIFIRRGLDKIMARQNVEADYNVYLGGSTGCTWGDHHSKTLPQEGGFQLHAGRGYVDMVFDRAVLPDIESPEINVEFIGKFALSQSLEWPDGKPIQLNVDFFDYPVEKTVLTGPIARGYKKGVKKMRLFGTSITTEEKK